MKNYGLFGYLLLFSITASAQFSVRLIITDVATRKNDDIYLMGNFNNWNPHDENYKLKPFGGSRKSIVLKDIAAGTYAFKFTRGATDRIETTSDGRDINDRVIEVNADISQEFTIAGWKDDYPDVPKKYTASPQVRIIDTAFQIPQLGRKRRIWIYLPKGYAGSSKIYPVLYMHDGQNLFNQQTARAEEWGVDECLDTLQQQTAKECIVVGIDNSRERDREYNPYDDPKNGKGEGKQYLEFIVKTLKPFIDSKYHTKKSVENTFIAGSEKGAVISLYAMLQYPDVFGAAGIFSPCFFISDKIFPELEKFVPARVSRFFMYIGKREPQDIQPGFEKMAALLAKQPAFTVRTVVNPLGKQNETSWSEEFAHFYKWLMNN